MAAPGSDKNLLLGPMLPRAVLRFWCAESALQYYATLKDACFTYLWPIRMPALSEVLCLRDGPLENLWAGSGVGGAKCKKKNSRKRNFSLISLIQTNKYFYQFSRFFQNILQFRAFHCSQWKTRFSSLLLGGNILTSIFQNAMSQSSQGTKASNAHDAVPMFCEHPLKILKAKTIKFWYNEGQLVSVPKGQCMDRLSKEYKRR